VPIATHFGTADDIDSLEPLWAGMVEHHRSVSDWPVRGRQAAWEIRRPHYHGWLERGEGFLLLASVDSSDVAGYAFCTLTAGSPTFDLGPLRGEVEDLAVAPGMRGHGIGTALLEACRDELIRRGARYWSVGVVEGNDGAQALYERLGFSPWFHFLAAPLPTAS
jgi:ribosomal protein S18 acetylase RimI-like enzyme